MIPKKNDHVLVMVVLLLILVGILLFLFCIIRSDHNLIKERTRMKKKMDIFIIIILCFHFSYHTVVIVQCYRCEGIYLFRKAKMTDVYQSIRI